MGLFLIAPLVFGVFGGAAKSQDPAGALGAIFRRTSESPSLEAARAALLPVLCDEALLRSAFLATAPVDERSIYILFGGSWGGAPVEWKDRNRWKRVLVGSISTKPAIIRRVLRADRYATSLERTVSRGAATINSFLSFEASPYADDLVERVMEGLRKESAGPARDLVFMQRVVLTAEELEIDLLLTWQMLCGVCDRLDLLEGAAPRSWRDRFPILDEWFRKNRPYLNWDESNSCLRIDPKAKAAFSPTRRQARAIPELKPPWMSSKSSK